MKARWEILKNKEEENKIKEKEFAKFAKSSELQRIKDNK